MPNLDLIPDDQYKNLDPYHYLVDNMPLTQLSTKINLVNDAVDIVSDQIRNSIGTTGTLSARLNASLLPSGELSSAAMDTALHGIGAHTDGTYDGVSYVRYTLDERNKLSEIATDATSLKIQFDTISNSVLFSDSTVEVIQSSGVVWNVLPGNLVKANLTFPTSAIHRHYYDQQPLPQSNNPDYINYKVSSAIVSFIPDSLRVYVNGYMLSQDTYVDVPLGVHQTATAIKFSESPTTGQFSLTSAITATDVIRIDFDIILTSPGDDSGGAITSGAQGSQGFQGFQGFQGQFGGPQGYQGSQGVQGTQGLQGNQGNQGNQGQQGNQGLQGNQGNQGNQGVSVTGPTGSTGPQGTSIVGPQGNQGSLGNQGVQGVQGSVGSTGSQGNQGNQGAFGGPQGNQGTAGNQGFQGPIGQSGVGVQGYQGNQGAAGLSGLAMGTPISGGTPGYLLSESHTGVLAQPSGLYWDDFHNYFGINVLPSYPFDFNILSQSTPIGFDVFGSVSYDDTSLANKTLLNVQQTIVCHSNNTSTATAMKVSAVRNDSNSSQLTEMIGVSLLYGQTGGTGQFATTCGLVVQPYRQGGIVTKAVDIWLQNDVTGSGTYGTHYGILQSSTSSISTFYGLIGLNADPSLGTFSPSMLVTAVTNHGGIELCSSDTTAALPLLTVTHNSDRSTSLLQIDYLGNISCNTSAGNKIGLTSNEKIGFHGATPVALQTVTGSRSSGTALQNLLTALSIKGIIVDNTTA